MTFGLTLAIYIALTQAMTMIYSQVYLGYDVVNGANDAEAMITVFTLWYILFGPQATMLRRIAKFLKDRDTYDEE